MKNLYFLILIFPSLSYAVTASVGSHVPYFNQAQVSETGATQKVDINPYFGIGTQIWLFDSHYFLPEFAYSYYLDNPSGSSREIFFLHYDFGYTLNDFFLLRYGLTTHYYRIKGEGGNTKLKNGNSSQSFPNPDETITTHFTTLDLGAETFFRQRTRSVRFDLNLMNFKDFDHTSFNYILTVNFYL